LKILPTEVMNALVVGSILSITINPILYQRIEPTVRWLESHKLLRPVSVALSSNPFQKDSARDHVVVIGYGPVGRTVSRILTDNGIQTVIIEMNIDTVQKLTAEGRQAIYGDAAQSEILRNAQLEAAAGLIISSSTAEAAGIIKAARELNPKLRILTRASYLAESDALRKAGANAIFSSEGEVALSMADFLMEQLGATDEQIDRERDRVRKDLFNVV